MAGESQTILQSGLNSGSQTWLGPLSAPPLAISLPWIVGEASAAEPAPLEGVLSVDAAPSAYVNAPLTDLITQGTRRYDAGLGDQNPDLLAPLKSYGRLLDGVNDGVNLLLTPVDRLNERLEVVPDADFQLARPEGATRDLQEGLVGTAAILTSLYIIYSNYNGRILAPGKALLREALPYLGLYFAMQTGARFTTDLVNAYRRLGWEGLAPDQIFDQINTVVMMNGWTTWAAFSPVWTPVAILAFPLSAVWMKLFASRTTRSGDYILSGGKFIEGALKELQNLLAALKPGNGGNKTFKFNVSAEHLASAQVIKAAEALGDMPATVTFGFDSVGYRFVRENFMAMVKKGEAEKISVKATYLENLKKPVTFVAPIHEEGKPEPDWDVVMQGSVIFNEKGELETLKGNLPVKKGEVQVVSGVVQKTVVVAPDNEKLPKHLEEAKFQIAVSGAAGTVLPGTGKIISTRPVSEDTIWQVFNFTPKAARAKLRSQFAPTAVNVELGVSPQDEARLAKDLQGVSSQRQTVSQLYEDPVTEFSRPVVEYLVEQGKNSEITLSVKQAELNRVADIVQLSGDKVIFVLRLTGSRAVQVAAVKKGKDYVFTLKAEEALTAAKDSKSLLTRLAVKESVNVVLANPVVKASDLWAISEAEKVASRVKPGSTLSYKEALQETPSILKTFQNSFKFGRARSVAARTMSTFFMSATIAFLSKKAQGFGTKTALVTSSRTLISGVINSSLAPTFVSRLGMARHIGFTAYLGSVTWLTGLELFNELKESDLLLFNEEIQDIQGENRPEVRAEIAERMRQLEIDTYRTHPDLREGFIEERIQHFMATGVATPEDATLLKGLYEAGEGSRTGWDGHFLAALLLDDGLKASVNASPDVRDFFSAEVAEHKVDIETAIKDMNLSIPAGFTIAL